LEVEPLARTTTADVPTPLSAATVSLRVGSPVDRVADLHGVVAIGGDLEEHDRIRVEAVVVDVRELLALGVVDGQRGLEPPRHRVGEVGDQLTRADGDHQLLPLARCEAEAVDITGHDLAVGHRWEREARVLRGAPPGIPAAAAAPPPPLRSLRVWCLRLLDLGQVTDAEHHRVRQVAAGKEAQLPQTELGVRRDRDPQHGGIRERGVGPSPVAVVNRGTVFPQRLFVLGRPGLVCSRGLLPAPFAATLPATLPAALLSALLRLPSQGRLLPLQLLRLLAQLVELPPVQRPGVAHDLGADAGAGDEDAGDGTQVLAGDPHVEGRALLAAGRVGVADVRDALGECGRRDHQQERCQAENPVECVECVESMGCSVVYRISVRRPPVFAFVLSFFRAVGITVSLRPWGFGSGAVASMPSRS
jgi:hypothetical protein